jgi:hypothetical protein
VALVDHANRAVRMRRLAVRTGKPTADVFDPECFFRAGRMQRVLNLIGNADAFVVLG